MVEYTFWQWNKSTLFEMASNSTYWEQSIHPPIGWKKSWCHLQYFSNDFVKSSSLQIPFLWALYITEYWKLWWYIIRPQWDCHDAYYQSACYWVGAVAIEADARMNPSEDRARTLFQLHNARTFKEHRNINPYSAGINIRRQNMTSVDVIFCRLKLIPAL